MAREPPLGAAPFLRGAFFVIVNVNNLLKNILFLFT